MHVNPRVRALLEGFEHGALPGIDLSLTRMERLLAALGHPQRRLPPVMHVAGTNGKGSTIAFLRAMLEAGGRSVNAYTSPHLVRFNERIVLAGREIEDAPLINLLARVRTAAQDIPVTFFEATTAAAFLAFAEHPADMLLLEVGLGGRLDATNMVTPIASLITPIGHDHQEFLGAGLAAIAREKAGIIKPGVPVFTSAEQPPEALAAIRQAARENHAPLTLVETPAALATGMIGVHQRQNAALARAALTTLGRVDADAITAGLHATRWPARLQRLTEGPLAEINGSWWLDGAHNAHAAAMLAQWAAAQPAPRVMLCGMLARKDAASYFRALQGGVDAVIAMPIPGAADGQDPLRLRDAARAAGLTAEAAVSLHDAMEAAKRYRPATVIAAGSLQLAGELLKLHERPGGL